LSENFLRNSIGKLRKPGLTEQNVVSECILSFKVQFPYADKCTVCMSKFQIIFYTHVMMRIQSESAGYF